MRTIKSIITAQAVPEGAGVVVRRAFPMHRLDNLDPFLLLDHLGPTDFQPGQAKGFPDHPHRGFETVSYVLSGRAEHKDSSNNHGILGPGDVQWMTAGSGVIHSEMPEKSFRQSGGRMEMFQLWVNLPAKNKMMAPRYQDTRSEAIPVYESPDKTVWIKVIAGASQGVSAAISTVIPILYLHLKLKAGTTFTQEIPRQHTTLAYVMEGQVRFEGSADTVIAEQMPVFNHDGNAVGITAETDASLLLISGEPLHEPIARYGPFVMNSESEIRQALADYQQGRLVQPQL